MVTHFATWIKFLNFWSSKSEVRRGPHSVLQDVYQYCGAGRSRLNHGRPTPGDPWANPGEFERLLNYLSDADARPG
jgi:hypothetical protein